MSLPTIPCTLEYDDPEGDGFVAFVDAPTYTGYIGDWDMASITELFTLRSQQGSLAVQYVGQENCWVTLDVRTSPSDRACVREVALPLTITDGQLWATSYTDLTMVAQFEDYRLIDQLGTQPVLSLENGRYVLTFRWLALDAEGVQPVPVELVVSPGTCPAPDPFPGGRDLL